MGRLDLIELAEAIYYGESTGDLMAKFGVTVKDGDVSLLSEPTIEGIRKNIVIIRNKI
ncbi:MAG: hypothetical protein KY054_03090 [Candidatus Nealsonbacteria bacterium]|nr:hypothetical protein [Candidatus Nealsonbacteria bacterium]